MPFAIELWVDPVFGRFESWRCIWLVEVAKQTTNLRGRSTMDDATIIEFPVDTPLLTF